MSVKLISGPWESGNTSQRARQEAHVTRNIAPTPDTREAITKRLVDSLDAHFYIDESGQSEDSQSRLQDDVSDLEELRSILNSCKRHRVGKTSSKALQDLQKRVTVSLDLPEWSSSSIDWGLLPKRTYQLKPKPVSNTKKTTRDVSSAKVKSKDVVDARLKKEKVANAQRNRNTTSDTQPKSRPQSQVIQSRDSDEKTSPTIIASSDDCKITKLDKPGERSNSNNCSSEIVEKQDSDNQNEELPVQVHHILSSLDRGYSQYHREHRHSATRVRVLEDTHRNNGLVAPIGSLVLKEARRYRRPYHSAANLPVTVSKERYQRSYSSMEPTKHQTKVYTPVERALERKSASYESQIRRMRNKDAAASRVQVFRVASPSEERPMSLPRLSGKITNRPLPRAKSNLEQMFYKSTPSIKNISNQRAKSKQEEPKKQDALQYGDTDQKMESLGIDNDQETDDCSEIDSLSVHVAVKVEVVRSVDYD